MKNGGCAFEIQPGKRVFSATLDAALILVAILMPCCKQGETSTAMIAVHVYTLLQVQTRNDHRTNHHQIKLSNMPNPMDVLHVQKMSSIDCVDEIERDKTRRMPRRRSGQ
jgi:hypothetical protein